MARFRQRATFAFYTALAAILHHYGYPAAAICLLAVIGYDIAADADKANPSRFDKLITTFGYQILEDMQKLAKDTRLTGPGIIHYSDREADLDGAHIKIRVAAVAGAKDA